MDKYRINYNLMTIGHNPVGFNPDFSAKIGVITDDGAYNNQNFNLNVNVYNSGLTNPYYVYASCSTDSNYKITGTTYMINRNTNQNYILRGLLANSGTSTINVKLYYINTLIDEKNYTISVANTIISGGTITTTGTSTLHTYSTTGITDYFYCSGVSSLTIDYLIVAGGGGGGSDAYAAGSVGAGGGGAGGILYVTGYTLQPGTYQVIVGSGGTGGIGASITFAVDGQNSTFGTIIAYGGGHGTDYNGAQCHDGGSGGGSVQGNNFGYGIIGQGKNGGGSETYHNGGSGGGGAGQIGFAYGSGTNNGGAGGSGITCSITGSGITYAGGGGGGGNVGGGASGGVGGLGGGGNGGTNGILTGQPGIDGLGSGGGGAAGTTGTNNGGKGGDGKVIIRYTTL